MVQLAELALGAVQKGSAWVGFSQKGLAGVSAKGENVPTAGLKA